MALQRLRLCLRHLKNIHPTVFIFLPVLALLPILTQIIANFHIGGLSILLRFFYSAATPSLDPIVLQNAWTGLQLTIATALISWLLSLLIGTILGFLSSNIFWKSITGYAWIGISIRRILAIPRSIHEVIWGILLLQIIGLNSSVAILAIILPYSCLMARVIANQLDTMNINPLIAISQTGAGASSAFLTALIPPMVPIITTYGGYRLECALRAATLLGIFGLGGIGTELQLTMQSLTFKELWTSLWMLGITMFLLEKFLSRVRNKRFSFNPQNKLFISTLIINSIVLIIVVSSLHLFKLNLFFNVSLNELYIPNLLDLRNAITQLPLAKLIGHTISLTFLSSAVAIAIPPICLIFCQGAIAQEILSFIWLFLRLIPAPLIVLLFLLCCNPNISIAAFALGINNSGVMGRILKDILSIQNNLLFNAIRSSGSTNKIAWLYGKLSLESKKYLALSAYRTDVILRETAIVGIAGGIGLGWQLQESLSSFDWSQVIVITATFALLTLIGETISDEAQQYWINQSRNSSLKLSLQS